MRTKTLRRKTDSVIVVWVFILACFPVRQLAAQAIDLSKMNPDDRKAAQSKIEAASRIDLQNMMNLLGLKTPVLVAQMEDPTRPPNLTQKVVGSGYWFDSVGSQITRTMWGNWTNYDESKANHYVLPELLKLKSGKPVNKASVWWKERRPEILADYEKVIYGYMPANLPKVSYEVTSVDTNARDGQEYGADGFRSGFSKGVGHWDGEYRCLTSRQWRRF
jgi:hypothetical protein